MITLDEAQFKVQFDRFCKLIEYRDKGRPFTNFNEGVAGVWELYKPQLRRRALALLEPESWSPGQIGTGAILERAIAAIEIDDQGAKLQNNLLLWQNRYGHANREHRALLEAQSNAGRRSKIETALYELYRGTAEEGAIFDHLRDLTYAKYRLLAYLFFLKDMDRFLPILPTTFDAAFRDLHVDLVTRGHCSWENYQDFNEAIAQVRQALLRIGTLGDVRLIDAHSFCWMLERLEAPPPGSTGLINRSGRDPGRRFGPKEISLVEIRRTVVQTVAQSRGQIEERVIKVKELRMTEGELDELLKELMELQEERCALTGLRFQFPGRPDTDKNLLPSVDRIDSSGHYESGNLQLVCRFVNFWKQDSDDEEFRRLLLLVRGVDDEA